MADLASARLNMVDSQVRTADVTDVRIHDAMRAIPREDFMPPARAYLAYADMAVEYAPGRWLLKPRDLGKLLQAIKGLPGERALAIAAPYAALVLEGMGLSVDRLDGADLSQPPGEGYDLIVCEGAVDAAPAAWIAALSVAGRLGVVERTGPVGHAVIYRRGDEGFGRRSVFDSTPPVLAGFETRTSFAL